MKDLSKKIFADSMVNTGRQVEFDYLKGLLWFVILFVHAFQINGMGVGMETEAYKLIFSIISMIGAPVFLFVLGMGTRYSKISVIEMLRSGGKLFLYQYLSNIVYAVSILLPFLILSLFRDMSNHTELVTQFSILFVLYINIFFLAGGIYMVLALLGKLRAPIWLYIVLGLVINIFSPYLLGLSTGLIPVDYLLAGIFGGPQYASFSILNYLPYAFFGVAFGELLKRVTDKKRFYALCCSISAALLAVFFIWVLGTRAGIPELYDYMSTTYRNPEFIRTIANTASVIMTAGIMFFLSGIIAKLRAVHHLLTYYSKHISKYYAVHQTFFIFVCGFSGFNFFGFWGCVVLFVISVFYNDAIVRLYNRFSEKRKKQKALRNEPSLQEEV